MRKIASVIFVLAMCTGAFADTVRSYLKFTGDLGYVASIHLVYNDSLSRVYADVDTNEVVGIYDLYYRFFDPSGALIKSGYDIQNGVNSYWYTHFSFDTQAKQLTDGSLLDFGDNNEVAYLGGVVKDSLVRFTLVGMNQKALNYVTIDQFNRAPTITTIVPDVGSTALLVSLGLAGLVVFKRKSRLAK